MLPLSLISPVFALAAVTFVGLFARGMLVQHLVYQYRIWTLFPVSMANAQLALTGECQLRSKLQKIRLTVTSAAEVAIFREATRAFSTARQLRLTSHVPVLDENTKFRELFANVRANQSHKRPAGT